MEAERGAQTGRDTGLKQVASTGATHVTRGRWEAALLEEGKQSRFRSRDGFSPAAAEAMGRGAKGGFQVLALGTLASHASQVCKSPKAAKVAVTLVGVMGLSLVAGQVGASPTAHAASGLRYHPGYSVQHGWLCYGWSNGTYHCTSHWKVSGGHYVSLNPSWVPSSGSRAAAGGGSHSSARGSSHSAPRSVSTTGSVSRRAGGGNTAGYPFGYCTYGAAALSWDNVTGLGNAYQWIYRAQARGMSTGYSPRVGATVVFQPGVQGASSGGHVAHVTAVYSNGAFEVEEMDYYGYGGGFGRFSFRTAHTGAGVAFIY